MIRPPLRSEARPPRSEARLDHASNVRALARLLDSAVGIPGTKLRFGLDALIGLIPGLGDLAGAAASGYIVLASAKLGAPTPVLIRMVANVAIDAVVGSVPLLGDLFDVGWRANTRNTALLDRHLSAPTETRRTSRLVVAGIVVALVLLGIGAIALGIVIARAIIGLVAMATG
jgi:hypothetical protein